MVLLEDMLWSLPPSVPGGTFPRSLPSSFLHFLVEVGGVWGEPRAKKEHLPWSNIKVNVTAGEVEHLPPHLLSFQACPRGSGRGCGDT